MSTSDELRALADRLYGAMAGQSYYQLLDVSPTADAATVRAAFYGIAARLHPDRFAAVPEAELRDRLEIVYARAAEAYRVLSSPERRATYDRQLAAGKLRLDLTARESTVPKNPEDSIRHPEAKKFFRLGMVCLGRKDWKGAAMNFTFAKGFEPGAAVIAQKLAEAQAGGAK
jgi:curved DNA-binding protein CbpA